MGAKAIVFTVDVMWQSKRTMDVRAKLPSPSDAKADAPAPASVSHSISGYQDYNLTWKDLSFIRVSDNDHVCEFVGNRWLTH